MENNQETFDDYKFKNTNKKIVLSLRQINEKVLSPWQISNFVSNFNTYYYKSEVVHTIGIALTEGINPENIIIFDESFKIDRQYSKLSYLSTIDKDLKNLYYLGKPISLFPKTEILVMNLLFKYFRKVNEFLYQTMDAKPLNSDLLNLYYKTFIDKSFYSMLELMKKDVKNTLKKAKIEKSETLKFEELWKEYLESYKTIEKDLPTIDKIKEHLKNNELDKINFKDALFIKYFKGFYKYISRTQRPVIGVYNDNHIITILCRAHINKEEANVVTMSLKSITHNSPIAGVFEAGATVYKTINSENREEQLHKLKLEQEQLKVEKEKINLELMKKDLEFKERQIQNQELDYQIKKLELIEKKISVIEKINNAEIEGSLEINIPNPYLKIQIQDLRNNIAQKSLNLMNKNNFGVDFDKTDVIDIRV